MSKFCIENITFFNSGSLYTSATASSTAALHLVPVFWRHSFEFGAQLHHYFKSQYLSFSHVTFTV